MAGVQAPPCSAGPSTEARRLPAQQQRGAARCARGAVAGGLPTQTPFSAAASAEPGCPCPHCTLNRSGLFGEDQRQLVGERGPGLQA